MAKTKYAAGCVGCMYTIGKAGTCSMTYLCSGKSAEELKIEREKKTKE